MIWNFKRIECILVLCATLFAPVHMDCPEHTYTIGNKEFVWPQTASTELWIASDCLDEEKRLIFRRCLNDEWIPNNIEFETLCMYENAELPSNDCPHNFRSIEIQVQGSLSKIICARNKGIIYNFVTDSGVCIQDNFFTVDFSNEEQTQFITILAQEMSENHGLFPLGVRSRYPSKTISKNINYEIEDVELHDVRCGRHGLPLTFNNTVPVHCTEDVCTNMCLSLNATTEPFSRVIDECNNYIIAKPKNTFLHSIHCPSGYYRVEFDYVELGNFNKCFSIQMFPVPIPVEDLRKINVLDSYCNGTIMPIYWGDDVFAFRQISEKVGLTDEDFCLFGLTPNEIIEYSQWNSTYSSLMNLYNFNWDKKMNFTRISTVDEVSYLTAKATGQWTWAVNTVSCIACMADSPIRATEFHLKYNIFERKLELEVTYQEYLYKENSFDVGFICYSLFREIYKANLTISPVANSISKYVIDDVGLGQYWCSGHSVINRNFRTCNRIFAYGFWFAFQVELECSTQCSPSSDDLNLFLNLIKASIGFASVMDSTSVGDVIFETGRGYSFTVHLSLMRHADVTIDNISGNLTDHETETVFIYKKLNEILDFNEANEMNINFIRSTEYCPRRTLYNDKIIWQAAKFGETISSPALSCQENNSEITLICSGDSIHGYFWKVPKYALGCETFVSESLSELYLQFLNHFNQIKLLENLKNLIQDNINILLPADVLLTSQILQNISNVTLIELNYVLSIYNNLLKIEESALRVSTSWNSSNVLLEVWETILYSHITSFVVSSTEYQDYGNFSISSSFIETFVFDPIVSGVSGIALYRPRNTNNQENDLRIYSIRYIHTNETFDDLLTNQINDKILVVGSYIPADILSTIENSTIIMTVFFNDKLFQSTQEHLDKNDFKISGKIISVNILGLVDNSNLLSKIPIFFESVRSRANHRANHSLCGYWSFIGWSSDGCILKETFTNNFQQIALCDCSHFSHFGYLIANEIHDPMLTYITLIAFSFAVLATLRIFVRATAFQKWRNKLASKMLINFAASIALQMTLMILITIDDLFSIFSGDQLTFIILNSVFHYSVLVMFFWMIVIAYSQLKGQCVVFNFDVSHLLLKSIIFGWGVPFLTVITILAVNYSLYLPGVYDEPKFSYPTGWGLYFGVVAPIALTSFINIIAFVSVLIKLYKGSSTKGVAETTKFKMIFFHIRLSAFLFSTLGLTWFFGFLTKILPYANWMLTYLFCFAAITQGLVLFLFFIVVDFNVCSLWQIRFKHIFCHSV